MAKRKDLGQIDASRDYAAVCRVEHDDRPDEFEIWFNPEALHFDLYDLYRAKNNIGTLSGGRWTMKEEEINIGRFILRENRNRPENDYGSDRAISEIMALMLKSEKPKFHENEERKLLAKMRKAAKKNRNAAV